MWRAVSLLVVLVVSAGCGGRTGADLHVVADAGSRTDTGVMDAQVVRDASVSADARVDAPVDARVMDARVVDAVVVDAIVDGDAQVARTLCCSASGVTSDCTRDCAPVGVTFERMWPCPAQSVSCAQSIRFDGQRAAIVDLERTRARDYVCLGSVLLDRSNGVLGRYDDASGLLLFEGDSFCASERCRALWQRDGCLSLFDGRWQGASTGCLEEGDFDPRGCPYDLTFEPAPQWSPNPQPGPVCIVWGDDFVYEAPLTCSNNIGTCSAQPLRVHPTLGIEYGGRWHPSSVVPCQELVGAWIATDCACGDNTMDPAGTFCAPTLTVEVDGAGTLGDSDNATGRIQCDGNDFVFVPGDVPSPPDLAEFARGEIDVATDTLSVYWHRRAWVFARASER